MCGKNLTNKCSVDESLKAKILGQDTVNVNIENGKNAHKLNLKASSELEVEPSAGFGPATITLPR